MPKGRKSRLVEAARVCQRLIHSLSWCEIPLRAVIARRGKDRDVQAVFVVAPPRSGSTLTYQVFRSGLKGMYLSNLSNLLYSMPAMGGLINRMLCAHSRSTFQSEHGLVSGICGEAEGMRFWKHWGGQGLDESPEHLNEPQMKRIAAILTGVSSRDGVFVSGYLGHAFCMEALRSAFPNSLFIHLTRDLVSNAYSLYRFSPEKWSSLRPIGYENFSHLPQHHQAVEQIIQIQQRLLNQARDSDTITVDYTRLCESPAELIDRVINFARSKDLDLHVQKNAMIPDRFPTSKPTQTDDKIFKAIQLYAQKRLDELSNTQESLYRLLRCTNSER